MAKVTLDYNFAASKNIEGGISPAELEAMLEKARYGFSKLAELIQNEKIGFTALPSQDLEPIKEFARSIHRKYNDLVVIGIGGSSLGFEALAQAVLPLAHNSLSFSDRHGYPRFWVLDNVDSSRCNSVIKYCKPEDTFVIVISKSGRTMEVAANFSVIFDWMKKANVDFKKQMAIVTQRDTGPLAAFAAEESVPVFEIRGNVGGRYSVLSPVGLLPAVILGIDIDKLLAGAASVVNSDWEQFLTLAAIYMHFMETKPINVLMPYSSKLIKFTEWFVQLWAESLGKEKQDKDGVTCFGTTALAAYGAVDQHAQLQLYLDGPADKFITFISELSCTFDTVIPGYVHPDFSYLEGTNMHDLMNVELCATEAELLSKGRPSLRLNVAVLDEFAIGELFMLFQHVVAIIGLANDINPFDQPAVENGKQMVYGLLGRVGCEGEKEKFDRIYVKSPEFII